MHNNSSLTQSMTSNKYFKICSKITGLWNNGHCDLYLMQSLHHTDSLSKSIMFSNQIAFKIYNRAELLVILTYTYTWASHYQNKDWKGNTRKKHLLCGQSRGDHMSHFRKILRTDFRKKCEQLICEYEYVRTIWPAVDSKLTIASFKNIFYNDDIRKYAKCHKYRWQLLVE